MLRLGLAVTALALAACAPEIPDSNPDKGVGFGDYDSYRTQTTQAPPPSVETTVIPAAPNTDTTRASDVPSVAPGGGAVPPVVVDVKPAPVPTRSDGQGPGIVEFALSTSHPVGTKLYRRNPLTGGAARAARNCAGYSSAELAQEAFLENGGPEKDALKLDPDGDGYACAWDPTVFRQISG